MRQSLLTLLLCAGTALAVQPAFAAQQPYEAVVATYDTAGADDPELKTFIESLQKAVDSGDVTALKLSVAKDLAIFTPAVGFPEAAAPSPLANPDKHQAEVRLDEAAALMGSADVDYSAAWVNRLGDLPVYPGGQVSEAAGSDKPGCALRIVSFTTTAPANRVIDYYYTQATKAGYDGEQQSDGRERVLGGTRAKDGGAYVVFVDPSDGGGSAVDLVVNNGK